MTSKTKTDWTFHRANFAVNYSSLSVAGYARQFDLNPNTAKAGLRGALTDPDNEQINLSEYDPGTGERLADKAKDKNTDRTVGQSMDRFTPDTPIRSTTDEDQKTKIKLNQMDTSMAFRGERHSRVLARKKCKKPKIGSIQGGSIR